MTHGGRAKARWHQSSSLQDEQLALHGGPGESHDYLEPLEKLADTGRPIVFYDQLGGGNSDQPHDPSLWSVELFLDELATVRQELGLKHIHLLGYSWGGMFAMEYVLTQLAGLASLILASALASIPQWIPEANRLREELPQEVEGECKALPRTGQSGETHSMD